jgi:hypothetical protein
MNKIVKAISALTAGIFFGGVLYTIEFAVVLGIASFLNGSVIYGKNRLILAGIVALADVAVVVASKDDKKEEDMK